MGAADAIDAHRKSLRARSGHDKQDESRNSDDDDEDDDAYGGAQGQVDDSLKQSISTSSAHHAVYLTIASCSIERSAGIEFAAGRRRCRSSTTTIGRSRGPITC